MPRRANILWALTEELPLRRNLGLAVTYVAERDPTTCTPCRANHLLARAQSLRHPETKCDKKGYEHTFHHVTNIRSHKHTNHRPHTKQKDGRNGTPFKNKNRNNHWFARHGVQVVGAHSATYVRARPEFLLKGNVSAQYLQNFGPAGHRFLIPCALHSFFGGWLFVG